MSNEKDFNADSKSSDALFKVFDEIAIGINKTAELVNQCARLVAENENLKRANGELLGEITAPEWMDIGSAPTETNATAIIFCPPDYIGEAFLGSDGFWYWAGAEVGYHDPIFDANSTPTHWMPLPSPPKGN